MTSMFSPNQFESLHTRRPAQNKPEAMRLAHSFLHANADLMFGRSYQAVVADQQPLPPASPLRLLHLLIALGRINRLHEHMSVTS